MRILKFRLTWKYKKELGNYLNYAVYWTYPHQLYNAMKLYGTLVSYISTFSCIGTPATYNNWYFNIFVIEIELICPYIIIQVMYLYILLLPLESNLSMILIKYPYLIVVHFSHNLLPIALIYKLEIYSCML